MKNWHKEAYKLLAKLDQLGLTNLSWGRTDDFKACINTLEEIVKDEEEHERNEDKI